MSFKPIGADELDDRHALNARFEAVNLPARVILFWSGSPDTVPAGWAICDGKNDTPDLRDRFILGAGGSYAVGAEGGEAQHALTAQEGPSHYHTMRDTILVSDYGADDTEWTGGKYQGGIESRADISTTVSGESAPHNNMPPYYALYYIMKL